MNVSQESVVAIVCREVFDESSHPSNEEVLDYATRLGIDPEVEPHLLGLAKEGLMAALPTGWLPCFHEATGAWYYYETSTGTTTWEHPLDAVYKELVKHARTGNKHMSLEEDSKSTTRELESHEEASVARESIKAPSAQPKIPQKLASLRKVKVESLGAKKREFKVEKVSARRDNPSKFENDVTSSSDRSARDYTNLAFHDPKFYESPRLLDASNKESPIVGSVDAKNPKRELDLREVLKRSESLSPRYEEEWEQLSNKFGSEENIIDIDKLSIDSLTKSDKLTDNVDDERQSSKDKNRRKELVLTGGGSVFLKSNRTKEISNVTNVENENDEVLANELRALVFTEDKNTSSIGERPKSILREKPSEDDDRHADEERKSVRFDLEKEMDIKFTYSGSEDESDTESDEPNIRISATITNKYTGVGSTRKSMTSPPFDSDDHNSIRPATPPVRDRGGNASSEIEKSENSRDKSCATLMKEQKIVAKRFLVENVSEVEHFSQISSGNSTATDRGAGDCGGNKFQRIKSIDLISRSENDSSATQNTSDSKSSTLEEIRRSKEIMLETMKRSDLQAKQEVQKEQNEAYHLMKLKYDLESAWGERERIKVRSQAAKSNFQAIKSNVRRERERELQDMTRKFQVKFEEAKMEMEEKFQEEKRYLEESFGGKLEEVRRELEEREKIEIERLTADMEKIRAENLSKLQNELEACYEKEKQEILENLKAELNERKMELLEYRNQEIEKLNMDHKKLLEDEKLVRVTEVELKKRQAERIEALKVKLAKEFEDTAMELRMQQREKISKVTEDHEINLAEILRDFRTDEDLARKEYKQRLEEIRASFAREIEREGKKQSEKLARPDAVDFEKIRCEKRLVEDKYKTLKEKYLKLKNDVRLAVESRTKRKEANATASETERSTSVRTKTDRDDSTDQKAPLRKIQSNSKLSEHVNPNESGNEDSRGQQQNTATSFTKLVGVDLQKITPNKLESDDTTTASEQNSNLLRKKKIFTKKAASTSKLNNNVENPVENIRKQLEKLEDLGDQLPSNESAYTLRYPFQDKAPANASSDIEFFKHRIHVERDSVRRAREALRQQRNVFQGRQRAWKQLSARATLEQLVQEERELSDMEVSLHRTRSLLGEKVIHLRHLERSLERVANTKKNKNERTAKSDELTLSDVSSASSGFSSTDLETDTFIGKSEHYQESTEIIASLENLNSEIREIWGVLNKRQDNSVPPPPTLMYSDLRWLPYQQLATHNQSNNVQAGFATPNIQSNILSQLTGAHPPTTTTQNIIAQYGPNSGYTTSVGTVERTTTNLMERTRNLRDWLRQARVESSDLVSPGQATL